MTNKAYETRIHKKLYEETGADEEGLKQRPRVIVKMIMGMIGTNGRANSTKDLGWELDLVDKSDWAGGEAGKQIWRENIPVVVCWKMNGS